MSISSKAQLKSLFKNYSSRYSTIVPYLCQRYNNWRCYSRSVWSIIQKLDNYHSISYKFHANSFMRLQHAPLLQWFIKHHHFMLKLLLSFCLLIITVHMFSFIRLDVSEIGNSSIQEKHHAYISNSHQLSISHKNTHILINLPLRAAIFLYQIL